VYEYRSVPNAIKGVDGRDSAAADRSMRHACLLDATDPIGSRSGLALFELDGTRRCADCDVVADEHFEGFIEGIEQASGTAEHLVVDATWPVRRSWSRLSLEERSSVEPVAPDLAASLDDLVRTFGRA
jgi:hypothetical protein